MRSQPPTITNETQTSTMAFQGRRRDSASTMAFQGRRQSSNLAQDHSLRTALEGHPTLSPARPGFTLVEMLVVITIIGILVALLIPAAAGVMARTRNGVIATEVQELSRAIEAYKSAVGDYPPDFTNRLAVLNHMQKAYPRNTRNMATWFTAAGPPAPANLDAAEALVFWLSRIRKNVRDPLGGAGEAVDYFKFEPTRLQDIDGDGWQEYYSQYAENAPYVYFDGREMSVPNPSGTGTLPTYAYAWAIYPSPYSTSTPAPNPPLRVSTSIPGLASVPAMGIVRPYRSNLAVPATELKTWQNLPAAGRTQWMAPGKYQIISAGTDGHFGLDDSSIVFKAYPTMNYYSGAQDRTNDDNNIGSFSEMKTLLDAVP